MSAFEAQRTLTPPNGVGRYGDSFRVEKIEGGYLVEIEHTDFQQSDSVLPAAVVDNPPIVKHKRKAVAATEERIAELLSEWSGEKIAVRFGVGSVAKDGAAPRRRRRGGNA